MADSTAVPPASILVIDDETENLKLVGDLLSAQGYTVRLLPQAQIALQSAQANPPDLVLLDSRLPDMDGYQLARRVREMTGRGTVRLIALTGYGTAADRQRAMEAGFDEHIVKPVGADRLAKLLS